VDTMLGLILPGAFTAFGTFLLRQFMLSIPSSLDEAAEIAGARSKANAERANVFLMSKT